MKLKRARGFRGRRGRSIGVGQFKVSVPPLTGHDILRVTNSAGSGLITTAAAHGLSGNELIVVTGTNGYNGPYNGASGKFTVQSPTTLLLPSAGYITDSYGGRWD